MRTPRILMCSPDYFGIEYEINPWMKRTLASVRDVAWHQWRTLRETLTGLGVVLAMTGGGPLRATQTLAMEMYTVAFRSLEFNQALAIATFILVLNALLTLAYVVVGRRFEYQQ